MTTYLAPRRSGSTRSLLDGGLRALTFLGLLTDAVVHLHLASGYQQAAPQGVGGGTLFRVQALLALGAAVYVLVRGSRRAYTLAVVVALSALAAVVAYRYVDIPAFGPLPAMYEPVWFGEKSLSAVAEAVAVAAAAAGALLTPARRRP